MESRAQLFGHSLHQILIVFPLGLLNTGVAFDVLRLITHEARWSAISYYITIAGLLGGTAAIVAGSIDYWAIPRNTRAKRIAQFHGLGGIGVVLLFAGSVYLRASDPFVVRPMALGLSFAGVLLAGVAGWLGGELVIRMGVGVADGAHLNAGGH